MRIHSFPSVVLIFLIFTACQNKSQTSRFDEWAVNMKDAFFLRFISKDSIVIIDPIRLREWRSIKLSDSLGRVYFESDSTKGKRLLFDFNLPKGSSTEIRPGVGVSDFGYHYVMDDIFFDTTLKDTIYQISFRPDSSNYDELKISSIFFLSKQSGMIGQTWAIFDRNKISDKTIGQCYQDRFRDFEEFSLK